MIEFNLKKERLNKCKYPRRNKLVDNNEYRDTKYKYITKYYVQGKIDRLLISNINRDINIIYSIFIKRCKFNHKLVDLHKYFFDAVHNNKLLYIDGKNILRKNKIKHPKEKSANLIWNIEYNNETITKVDLIKCAHMAARYNIPYFIGRYCVHNLLGNFGITSLKAIYIIDRNNYIDKYYYNEIQNVLNYGIGFNISNGEVQYVSYNKEELDNNIYPRYIFIKE